MTHDLRDQHAHSSGPHSISPHAISMWPRDAGHNAVAPGPLPAQQPAPASRDASTGIMMGVGVAMLVALSIIGVQLGRRERADHPERAAAASKPVAAAVAAPPKATTALPATPTAVPVSIELDDSETVPVIPANKLPDVTPGPGAVDTAMHGNASVPPNPY